MTETATSVVALEDIAVDPAIEEGIVPKRSARHALIRAALISLLTPCRLRRCEAVLDRSPENHTATEICDTKITLVIAYFVINAVQKVTNFYILPVDILVLRMNAGNRF